MEDKDKSPPNQRADPLSSLPSQAMLTPGLEASQTCTSFLEGFRIYVVFSATNDTNKTDSTELPRHLVTSLIGYR